MTKVSRIVIAAVVGSLLLATMPAQADLQVNFGNFWGLYAFGQTVGGTYIPAGTLIQLIWSPVNGIAALNSGAPTIPQGSEKLLFSTLGPDEGGWGLSTVDLDAGNIYLDSVFGVTLANGWIYGRIFDQAAPGAAGHYRNSALVQGQEWTNTFITTLDVAPGGADPGNAMNQTIAVPEPVSMALFGLGLVSMVALRLRKK